MSESGGTTSTTVAARAEMVIRDVLGLESQTFPGSSRLREDLGADSVDLVMLVMALEREFKGKILDDEAAKLSTVDEVVDYITKRIGEQGLA